MSNTPNSRRSQGDGDGVQALTEGTGDISLADSKNSLAAKTGDGKKDTSSPSKVPKLAPLKKHYWETLETNGPIFPPKFEPLPNDVTLLYNGKSVKLSEAAEEVATFYRDAKLENYVDADKTKLKKNFLADWRKCMTDKERELIKDIENCDFAKIFAYLEEQSKKKEKENVDEKEELDKDFGFAIVDGEKVEFAKPRVEQPGIFLERGDKLGRIKPRVKPSDVKVNCSTRGGRLPKEIQDENKPENKYVCSCKDELQDGKHKYNYIYLCPTRKHAQEDNEEKYENARALKRMKPSLRKFYEKNFGSANLNEQEIAVVLYLLDHEGFRVGREYDDTDNVELCTLQVKHIKLTDKKVGDKSVVEFDYPGKSSEVNKRDVPVDPRVFKILQRCITVQGEEVSNKEEKKDSGDRLFNINADGVARCLKDLFPGGRVTPAVFRTCVASDLFEGALAHYSAEAWPKGSDSQQFDTAMRENMLIYAHRLANLDVALQLNHRATQQLHKKKIEEILNMEKQLEVIKNDAELEGNKNAVERLGKQLTFLVRYRKMKENFKDAHWIQSLEYYIDPRITIAWCTKYKIPVEKVFTERIREIFRWAIEDFKF